MVQIFLCYAREDEARVRDVYTRLRTLGFELWMDKMNLLPGQQWRLEIPRALRASDFVLIFLSQHSVAKHRGYVHLEFKLALDTLEEMAEGVIHTIPVRLGDCAVPEQFHHLQWCNLFEEDGFVWLVRAIRAGVSQRQLEELTTPAVATGGSVAETRPATPRVERPPLHGIDPGEATPTRVLTQDIAPRLINSITILVLAANPTNMPPLRLNEEIREISAGLQRAQRRDKFTLQQQLAARPIDVRRAMLHYKPNLVHFCGHGSGEEGIAFEDAVGQAKLVSADTLEGFFALFADSVECVILNACYSEIQAEAIAKHIRYVIGMKRAIGDTAAMKFAVAFYDALGAGESIEFSYKVACNAIQRAGLPEHLTPVLESKRHFAPADIGASVVWDEVAVAVATDDAVEQHLDYCEKNLSAILREPKFYSFLQEIYEISPRFKMLTRDETRYPVAVLDSTRHQIQQWYPGPDPLLKKHGKWRKEPGRNLIRNPVYKLLRNRVATRYNKRPITDNTTYKMVRIDTGAQGLQIHCNRGLFDLTVDTADSLKYELGTRLSVADVQHLSPYELLERLPKRRDLTHAVPNAIVDGARRSPILAVSVLTVFRDNNEWVMWLLRRSTEGGVAVDPGKIHVIPSGMFTPECENYDVEFCLWHMIRREFIEEIFNVSKPKTGQPGYKWFYGHTPIIRLNEMLKSGEAELWRTGVVVDMCNLQPEVTALLLIRDPKWYTTFSDRAGKQPGEYIDICEEFATPEECHRRFPDREEAYVQRVIFRPDLTEKELLEQSRMVPDDSVPPGAAALFLGYEMLRDMAQKQLIKA